MAERIVFEGELDLEHLNLIKALSAREMYVEELAQIAERDERIVITGADVGAGGKIGEFREKYPDRFIRHRHRRGRSGRCVRRYGPQRQDRLIWQASARSSSCARSIRCIPT